VDITEKFKIEASQYLKVITREEPFGSTL